LISYLRKSLTFIIVFNLLLGVKNRVYATHLIKLDT